MKELPVVIDYQNDFVTGALGNPAAAALEDGIAARVEETLARGGRVLFTRDTHGEDYLERREGRFLPVPHCVRGTEGWRLYGALAKYEQGVREGVAVVEKNGKYGYIDRTGATVLPPIYEEATACKNGNVKLLSCGRLINKSIGGMQK